MVKKCTCCGREFSIKTWMDLDFVSVMADEVELLVLRNCPCGGTIARCFPPETPEQTKLLNQANTVLVLMLRLRTTAKRNGDENAAAIGTKRIASLRKNIAALVKHLEERPTESERSIEA